MWFLYRRGILQDLVRMCAVIFLLFCQAEFQKQLAFRSIIKMVLKEISKEKTSAKKATNKTELTNLTSGAKLTETETECILNIYSNTSPMNHTDKQHRELADGLSKAESDISRMALVKKTLNSRNRLESFLTALPKLHLKESVRNAIFILIATLLVTACGDGNSEYSDGDTDGESIAADGDADLIDHEQNEIDGDSEDVDGDEDNEESEKEIDGDFEDGEVTEDGDEEPVMKGCEAIDENDALACKLICPEDGAVTLKTVDSADPVLNGFELRDIKTNQCVAVIAQASVNSDHVGVIYYALDPYQPFVDGIPNPVPAISSTGAVAAKGKRFSITNTNGEIVNFEIINENGQIVSKTDTSETTMSMFSTSLPVDQIEAIFEDNPLEITTDDNTDGNIEDSETPQTRTEKDPNDANLIHFYFGVEDEKKDNYKGLKFDFSENGIDITDQMVEVDEGHFKARFTETGEHKVKLSVIVSEDMSILAEEDRTDTVVFTFIIEQQDPCKDVECGDNAICEAVENEANCECQEGYEGDTETACTDIDACSEENNPCNQNATCTDNPAPQLGASCECNYGFEGSGEECETIPLPEISNLSIDNEGFCVAGRTYPVTFDVANVENADDCNVSVSVRYESGYVATTPDQYAGELSELVLEGNTIKCNWTAPTVGGGDATLFVTCETEGGTDSQETEEYLIH